MKFDIEYTDFAFKQLKKLPKEISLRILKSLERCRVRPHAHIKKLVSSPYFRLRVGEYRVILDIKNGELIILVIEVGHRKKIYK